MRKVRKRSFLCFLVTLFQSHDDGWPSGREKARSPVPLSLVLRVHTDPILSRHVLKFRVRSSDELLHSYARFINGELPFEAACFTKGCFGVGGWEF